MGIGFRFRILVLTYAEQQPNMTNCFRSIKNITIVSYNRLKVKSILNANLVRYR